VVKRALVLALLVLLALPASALGHAELLESTPARDAQLERPPRQVAFRFSEPVEASFGAVQVLDDEGKRVDDGKLLRPGGRGDTVAAALPADLGSGTYTATYRVISADSHPVSGGIVFTLGDAAGSAVSVADALDQDEAGPVTTAGFGVIRGLAYAAMAVVLGGLLFVLAVWAPMLRAQADASAEWTWASIAFARRAHAVLAAGLAVGLATSLLGLAFQGAVAGGTSVWAAFDPAVIEGVLERVGAARVHDFEALYAADAEARARAGELISTLASHWPSTDDTTVAP
jgi:copper transport protein